MRNVAESSTPPQPEGVAAAPPPRGEACGAWTGGDDMIRPIKVAVLIDLEWSKRAGGHVKSWERLADAATRLPGLVDLTVHLQGRRPTVTPLAANVRFVTHRPVLSTAMFLSRASVPDHTDLAPLHPGLLHALRGLDVIHTTDAHFAYARTARLVARQRGVALVHSAHTETAGYTRIYSERILRRLPPLLAGPLVERLRLPDRLAASMTRALGRHLRACDRVLLSARGSHAAGNRPAPQKTGILRRGIDRQAFHPSRRDRARLAALYDIPPDRPVLLFVGRLEQGKSVQTVAQACRRLLDQGRDVSVILAGEGSEAEGIGAMLGDRAVLPGTVDPQALAWLYASADLFVFPSRIEESPNVVLEAKASGVPVIVAPGGGDVFVATPGVDGLVVAAADPRAWAEAIGALLSSETRRTALAAAGRRDVELHRPSWDDVLAEDLIPVWHAAAALRAQRRAEARPRPAGGQAQGTYATDRLTRVR
jgi:glycosyltransferase involved in cell wall biosynthesis